MARLARIAVVNLAHHVTQRGNARQFILANDGERMVYTGRPLGGESFVHSLEENTQRRLSAQKGGRPRNATGDQLQAALVFDGGQK